jgi:hypothetical protein
MIDDETWNDVLELYARDADRAFILAQVLFCLKQTLKKPKGKKTVARALELAIEKLYPYTGYYKASQKIFTTALAGKLKPKHDPTHIEPD